MATVVCICPPVGIGSGVVLCIAGTRVEWPELHLVTDVPDWLTGELLRTGWRCYGNGEIHISTHTLKFLVTGNHNGSSHASMAGIT